MSQNLVPLITYIVSKIRDMDGSPTKTQLVKLLYLLDLEYYKRHHRTLTQLKWIYYHYGPYTAELEAILKQLPDVDESEFESSKGRKGYTYYSQSNLDNDEDQFISAFGYPVKNILDPIIRRWALEELWILLDYVYFETEPMKNAHRGKPLDFSQSIRSTEKVLDLKEVKIPQEKLTELQRKFSESQKARQVKKEPTIFAPYDEVYHEAMRIMDEDELNSVYVPMKLSIDGPQE